MVRFPSERPLAFVATLAVLIAAGLAMNWRTNFEKRLGDFQRVAGALNAYKAANGRYPLQGKENLVIGLDPAASEFAVLVPKLLAHLPRDPANLSVANKQYLYFSNGTDFKFIAHAPEDAAFVGKQRPDLTDPRRPGFAYGIWSAGGAGW